MNDVLFAEVLATAMTDDVISASAAELSAWVSSALGLWREPGVAEDAVADDLAFVRWLSTQDRDVAVNLLAGLGAIAAGDARAAARELTSPLADPEIGSAWRFGRNEVVVLTFNHGDGDEVLLVDIENGRIADVQFATGADDLIKTAHVDGEVVAVEPQTIAAEIATALAALADSPPPPTEGQLANMALLRSRLAQLGQVSPDPHWPAEALTVRVDPDADRAAIATLRAAVPDLLAESPPPGAKAMIGPTSALTRCTDPTGRPVQDLEGLLSLEWADWLGATLGAVRAGSGTPISGSVLVDYVNRAPEITSAIPKRDRSWYEWVFALVIESWAEIGIIDADQRLTEPGRWVLPQALIAAWSDPDH